MSADRYLRVILTIVAVELAWIGIKDSAPPVLAQPAPTAVVITGIELRGEASYLPVGVVGGFRQIPIPMQRALEPLAVKVEADRPLKVEADRPLRIESVGPMRVDVVGPVIVETDNRPLKVEQVPYTPSPRPGE